METKAERERARNNARQKGILSPSLEKLLHGEGIAGAGAILFEALLRLWNDEAMSTAGNIAFRAVLALFPFLIFVSSLTAFLGDQQMARELTSFLIATVPQALVDTVAGELESVLTVRRGGLVSIGVLLTVWFAIGGVDGVRVALNRAYDIRENRSTPAIYMLQLMMVIGGAMTLVVLAYILVLSPALAALSRNYLPEFESATSLTDIFRYPAAFLILLANLFCAHFLLPARRVRIRDMWPGILLTVAVWTILVAFFSLYLVYFANYASYYAGLAGVMAALFFLYLAALVLIFGGEINRALRIRRLARVLRTK